MLYQVMQRHNFLPEAFTTDFQVHWGQHPLRPEFVESTYFLYRATGDPYYLEAGAKVMSSLQRYARVPCGKTTIGSAITERVTKLFYFLSFFSRLFLSRLCGCKRCSH